MTRHRSLAEVNRFNQFKAVITIILLLTIIILYFTTGFNTQQDTSMSSTATAVAAGFIPTTEPAPPTPTLIPIPPFSELDLPTVTNPLPTAGLLSLGTTTFNGLASPNSNLAFYLDAVLIDQITADDAGNWTIDVTHEKSGNSNIRIVTINEDGLSQSILNLTYEWENPADNPTTAPTLALESGGQLPPGSIPLFGNAVPNSRVAILINNVQIGTATANDTGQWSFDLDRQETGPFTIAIQALNSNDELLPLTTGDKTLTIVSPESIEEVRLNPPIITSASNSGVNITGEWKIVGTGVVSSTIELLINDTIIDTTTVSANGNWQFTTTIDTAGEYTFKVIAYDPTRLVQTESTPLTINITDAQSFAPLVTLPQDGDDLPAGDIIISGLATPNTTVILNVNNIEVERVPVGRDGFWGTRRNYNQAQTLTIIAASEADDGTIQGTALPVIITINPDKDPLCGQSGIDKGDTYIVGSCDFMAQIARDLGLNVNALIAANPQIENPSFLRAGQILTLPPRN